MNHTQRRFDSFITIAAFLALTGPAAVVCAQQQAKAIAGFAVGPEMDEIVPGRFLIDPPTIENLGFRWYIEGDSNRNASVAVAFRKKGQTRWTNALPMLQRHRPRAARHPHRLQHPHKPQTPEKGKTSKPADYDLRIRTTANVIDSGTGLPQITDNFTGKAPDIGCYELNQPPAHYGPRTF